VRAELLLGRARRFWPFGPVERLADAVLAAHIGDLDAGVGFLEDRHNLALCEFALLHGSVSVVPARILYFQPVS